MTLKDHKENFFTKTPCRLINPAKSEIGIISKKVLEDLNSDVRELSGVNQWRNSATVIEWFKRIPDKKKCRFIKFDVCEFYPSISESLLDKAISYAKMIATVNGDMMPIVQQARKSLLFDHECNAWVKKGANPMFDVTMGSHDGAEVCELVGLYLLNKLSSVVQKEHIGLYRDDGLAVITNANGPKMDKIRKTITGLFKQEGLSITIETNLSATDFLDVTFDLAANKYFPYRKPNDRPLYINAKSNHPPAVIKELPKMINRRLILRPY